MSKYLYLLSKNQFKAIFYLAVIVVLYKALTPNQEALLDFYQSDKVLHIIAFFTLSFLLNRASSSIKRRLRNMISLLAFGIFIEILQSFTGYREVSFWDIVADLIGIVLFQCTYSLLKALQIYKRQKNYHSKYKNNLK